MGICKQWVGICKQHAGIFFTQTGPTGRCLLVQTHLGCFVTGHDFSPAANSGCFVSGHDFSRAAKAAKKAWALAPERSPVLGG